MQRQSRPFIFFALLAVTLVSFGELPWFSPTFDIPSPQGPYRIGTTYLHLTDSSRQELFVDTIAYREIYAQVWYPSEHQGEVPVPYLQRPAQALQLITALFKLPKGFFDQLQFVETNSVLDSQVAADQLQFPVLLFQHGYSFWSSQNTILMEHLASHGFIVLSVAHPYETNFTYTREGQLVTYSYANAGLQRRWQEILNSDVSQLIRLIMDTESLAENRMHEEKMLALTPNLQVSVKRWADDASFLLDELALLNRENAHFLAGKLDMSQVGALGMSFGGAATAQLIVQDDRVKAGLNMDGGVRGDLLQKSIDKPFLFMISGDHGFLNNTHFQRCRSEAYLLKVNGAKHLDFCDLNLIAPDLFSKFGLIGTVDKHRMNRIINDYTLAFFLRHLLKDESTEMPSYPEVVMQQRNHD